MNFYPNFEWNQAIGTTRDQKLLTGNIMRNQNSSFYTSFENVESINPGPRLYYISFEIYSYYQGNKLSNWNSWSDKTPNHHNHLFLVVAKNPIRGWQNAITFDYWGSLAFPLLYDRDKYENDSQKARFQALSIARMEAFKHFVEEGTSAFDCFTFDYWVREFDDGHNSIKSKETFDACWKEYECLFQLLGRSHGVVNGLISDLCEWENQEDRTVWHLDHQPIVKERP